MGFEVALLHQHIATVRAFEWFAPVMNDKVFIPGLSGVEGGRTMGAFEV